MIDGVVATLQAPDTPAVLGVIFAAVLVRAIFGFGDVLVSVPILTLMVGPRVAVPLMGMVGATNALLILLRERSAVRWRPVRYLLMTSVVGIPLGVMALKWLPERWIAVALGVLLIGFCAWSLAGRRAIRLENPRWAWPFGFMAGCMGGAVTATGPPIVIYATTQGWSPQEMRGTLQGFFLPNGGVILLAHAIGGLWTPVVWQTYLCALPVLLLALPIGAALGNRLSAARFEQLTFVVLLATGVLLLVSG